MASRVETGAEAAGRDLTTRAATVQATAPGLQTQCVAHHRLVIIRIRQHIFWYFIAAAKLHIRALDQLFAWLKGVALGGDEVRLAGQFGKVVKRQPQPHG